MLAWIAGSVVFLVLLIYILIQVPAVQNFARKKVVSYLENKIHTKVQIAKLSLDFPKRLVLKGVYLEDQKKDTLLYGGELKVDIALLKLINSKVEINAIELKDINANIARRGSDTMFNYQYIIDAFVSAPKSNTPKDTTAGMQVSVDKIMLNNITATFKDDLAAIDFRVRLGKFQTAFKKFDLDKMIFTLPGILLEDVSGHMYQNKPLVKSQPTSVVEAKSNEPFKLQLG
ncbi:MAG: translocation/assembly module TamB, partial [Ferruginibacter sp.]